MENIYKNNPVATATAIPIPCFSHHYTINIRSFPFYCHYKPLATFRKNKYDNVWIINFYHDETLYTIPAEKNESQFIDALSSIGFKKNKYIKLSLFNSNDKNIKTKKFSSLSLMVRHLYFLERSLTGLTCT